MSPAGTQAGSKHRHPLFARVYPHISHGAEERGAADHRRSLLAGLRGRVVEVGSGHGLNFPYYPQTVTEVVAIEPEPHLRELARQAAWRAPVPITVSEGTAEALPFDDGELDAAVASLVLCSVDDQQAALAEIARVLRPGGELRYYEHVISHKPLAARVQRLLDATFYPPVSGGCHAARSTGEAIRAAGFQIEREEQIAFKPSPLLPAIPHILGVARRAESAPREEPESAPREELSRHGEKGLSVGSAALRAPAGMPRPHPHGCTEQEPC